MTEDDKDQQRLEELRNELNALQSRDESDTKNSNKYQHRENPDNMRQGMLAGTEFVGAIIVGGCIGYVLDVLIATWPVFFLIWLLLGIMTGFYNIYRITNEIDIQKPFQALHDEQKHDKTSTKNKDGS